MLDLYVYPFKLMFQHSVVILGPLHNFFLPPALCCSALLPFLIDRLKFFKEFLISSINGTKVYFIIFHSYVASRLSRRYFVWNLRNWAKLKNSYIGFFWNLIFMMLPAWSFAENKFRLFIALLLLMIPGVQVSLAQGGKGTFFSKFIKKKQNTDNEMFSDFKTGLIEKHTIKQNKVLSNSYYLYFHGTYQC